MSDEPMGRTRIERAKRQVVAGAMTPDGALPTDLGIAPQIVRSWRRCLEIDAAGRMPEPVSRPDLLARREAAALLWQSAQPELDALAEQVVAQGCIVILSDASGLILDGAGSSDFLPKAERVALRPGVDWSESQRGTNAIGTALAERSAVMVRGPEHTLRRNAGLGCAAAPVLTGAGELAGVLDVSGDAGRVDAHALALVRMAVAQVEHRMLQAVAAGRLLRFHRRGELLGSAREGLLAIADGRIRSLNRVAVALLGGSWSDWLGRPVADLFGRDWERLQRRAGEAAAIVSPQGETWVVAADGERPRRSRPGWPSRSISLSSAPPIATCSSSSATDAFARTCCTG